MYIHGVVKNSETIKGIGAGGRQERYTERLTSDYIWGYATDLIVGE